MAMKIGIYGNNLNQGYWMARGLQSLGMTAKLFVPNYLFAQATFGWWLDEAPDPDLVFETGTSDMDLKTLESLTANEKIRAAYGEAKNCDLLFLAEDGPAFFSELEGVKKIFRSTGADIQLIPFSHSINCNFTAFLRHVRNWLDANPPKLKHFIFGKRIRMNYFRNIWEAYSHNCQQFKIFQDRQIKGLQQCDSVICGPDQVPILRRLSLTHCPVYHLPLPMDTDGLESIDDGFATEIRERYRDTDLVFFHPSRQLLFRSHRDPYIKENVHLIKGFARFLRDTHGRVKLVLVEKGEQDAIGASKALIKKLGVENHVEWVAEMPFRRLAAFYRLEQCVVCVQFAKHAARLANTGREGSYFGRMVITAFGDHHRLLYGDDLPPHVLPAFTASQVCNAMRTVDEMGPAKRRERGREGAAWFMRQHSPEHALPRFVEVFERVLG